MLKISLLLSHSESTFQKYANVLIHKILVYIILNAYELILSENPRK